MTRAVRWALLGVLMAIPAVVVALAAANGPALSQDSISYLSTARSVLSGHGLTSLDGQALTLFPPGLPLVLATLGGLGVPIGTAALMVNILSVALVVLGTYLLGNLALRSTGAALAVTAVVSLSSANTEVYTWLWTEPLFTLLVVSALVGLLWMQRDGGCSWWLVIAVGALVSTSVSIRYVGLTLIPVAVMGTWWGGRPLGRRSGWARVGVVLAMSLLAPVAIVMRNLAEGSGPLGDRYPGVRTFEGSILDAVRVMGEYLLPPNASVLGVVVGALVVVLVLVGTWRSFIARDRLMGLLAIYAAIYTFAIVWSQTTTRLDSPSARLLAPAVPALAVLGVSGANRLRASVMRDLRERSAASEDGHELTRAVGPPVWVVGVLIGVVLGILTIANLRGDIRLVQDGRAEVVGLMAVAESSDSLMAGPPTTDGGFASDNPWLVYAAWGRSPVVFLPSDPSEWPQDRIQRDEQALVDGVRTGLIQQALVFDSDAATDLPSALAPLGVIATSLPSTGDGAWFSLEWAGN